MADFGSTDHTAPLAPRPSMEHGTAGLVVAAVPARSLPSASQLVKVLRRQLTSPASLFSPSS